jgi:hypothetical protein
MWFRQDATREPTALLPNGQSIRLDFVEDEEQAGYLATANGYIINQIRAAIASHSGGWVEVTEADYLAALKKKLKPNPSWLKRQRARGLTAGVFQPRETGGLGAQSAEAIVAAKPDPITVPTPEQLKLPPRPRVGKLVTK